MNSADNSLFARIGIGLTALAVIVGAVLFFDFNMRASTVFKDELLSLKGEWRFHNGQGVMGNLQFDEKVLVPEPLQSQIKNILADEFWYQKSFAIPDILLNSGKPLSLFLGTIKGEHEVYWNGDRIGSGGKLVLGIYSLPSTLVKNGQNDLRIRIKRSEHLFPGIVHMLPVAIGRSESLEIYREYYLFDSGAKPLILSTFKFCLFFLFAILFLITPQKREYFSFAFFVLFSALSAILYSRFIPVYFNYFLRNELTFLAATFSFCAIPWLTADILRLSNRNRALCRGYGIFLGLIFFTAAVGISGREKEIALYQLAGRWIPIAVGIPSVFSCLFCIKSFESKLKHRRLQVSVFAALLFMGTIGWWLSSGSLFTFQYVPYPELWDMGLFAGLALSATLDLWFSSKRADRAGKVVPKWFSSFLASGIDQVTLELPLIAMAVDTVGYTRMLAGLDEGGKSDLYESMRSRMAPVVEKFGAQKISDRGDGALFAWDFSGDEISKRRSVRSAIAAAEYISMEVQNSVGLTFRIGIAAGLVRGELKGSETSFMGDPLNAASRLESMAKPGTALLHESIVQYVNSNALGKEWIEMEIKGVSYKALPLNKAS